MPDVASSFPPVPGTAPAPLPAPPGAPFLGLSVLSGALAMAFVGGSVAVSSLLADAVLFTAQAVRYALACLLLVVLARVAGRALSRPRGAEWCWLVGVAGTGLVLFNVALVRGSAHAEPAVLAVAVACVPVALALAGPLLERQRPRPLVLAAAMVVTGGAVLVSGFGRTDVAGLAWALVVLACEVGFTLLAVPVLGRHGPWGVSVHATWLAAVAFAALGLVMEGPAAALTLGSAPLLAVAYLAVGVTAIAFVLWYSSVGSLGAARAGLLTGVAPVAAALTGIVLGGPTPAPPVWLGIGVVATGLAVGLAPKHRRRQAGRRQQRPPRESARARPPGHARRAASTGGT